MPDIKEERRKARETQQKFWTSFEEINYPKKEDLRKIIEYESQVPDEIPYLQEYLNGISRQYAKIRVTDVFKPYIYLIVIIGAAAFGVAFLAGYNLEVDNNIFPNLLYSNKTLDASGDSVARGNFEFAFILGTSAAASAGIAFAALGSNAIQSQTDRLYTLSYHMDKITDRILAMEIDQRRDQDKNPATDTNMKPPPDESPSAGIQKLVENEVAKQLATERILRKYDLQKKGVVTIISSLSDDVVKELDKANNTTNES